jgi:opacity protein-like surface antigen
MQMRILGLAVACLLAIASPATAEDAEYSRSGLYVGVAGTYAIQLGIEDRTKDLLPGSSVSADNALGFNARLGYRVIPYFAFEAQYEGISKFDVSADGSTAFQIGESVATMNLKGYYPLERFQPYALIGAGMMFTRTNDVGTTGIPSGNAGFTTRFGAGLDFHITENWLLTIEPSYVLPLGDVRDLDYLSIAWGFQFRL